jgi:hypothetical protein
MLNFIVWIALATTAAVVFVLVVNIDRNLNRRVQALEDALIEDVLDAVDELCFPLDDFERENVKLHVRGEYTE